LIRTISATQSFGVSLTGSAGDAATNSGYYARIPGYSLIGSTLSGSYASGVTLAVNPETIAGDATISSSGIGVTGLYGPTGTDWTLVNEGLISEAAPGTNYGVSFAGGGTISNAASGLIYGYAEGVRIAGAGASVFNLGTIQAVTLAPGGYGIFLPEGGAVTNGLAATTASSAVIEGYRGGIHFASGNASTLTNYGTVSGLPGSPGIVMRSGTVVNGGSSATGALIVAGEDGIDITGAATVINYGTISGWPDSGESTIYYGVKLIGSGSISNLGTASLIEAYFGVYAGSGVTVTNAGTIKCDTSAGTAILFGGGTNRLIVDPGAVFYGAINGGSLGSTAMELAAGTAGSIYGFGTRITNFSTVVFDPGSQWIIGGDDSPGGLGTLEISGFTVGDTIELTGFVPVSDTFNTGVLVLTNGGGQHATLHVDGAFTSGDFNYSGSDIIVCFARGTHIATPRGERPIEQLSPGDLVRTEFGGTAAIQWIGRRHVDCARHPDPRLAWPVQVAVDAMGPGRPHRDLLLSPNHAVWVHGELIPIRCLINGTSIAQLPVDEVTYYHIELAQHDLLWAEGLRAESYLDVGDRANFTNGGGPVRLFPDFATAIDNAMLWETKGCAPLVVQGPRLEAARAWVSKAAGRDAPPSRVPMSLRA
jgi:hypothetical protein